MKYDKTIFIGRDSYIRQPTKIGNNTKIGSKVVIEGHVEIGKNCNIQTGCIIVKHVKIEDNVFIAPGVITTNDKYPPSNNLENTLIKDGASIGAGSIILPGITIGEKSLIGAGSVVTKDVPKNTIAYGNPCKIIKQRDDLKWKKC